MKRSAFWRLTILDRYLFRQFTGPFFLAVAGFAVIAIIDILFYLVDLTVISGIPFLTTLRLLLYKMPAIMVLFFPMAVVFAVMLLLVRMAKDNEITVLRASGIHTWRIIFPILLMTIVASYLSFFINEQVVPWTNETSDALIAEQIEKKPPPDIVENIVFKENDRFFYIQQISSKTSTMRNITVFERANEFPRLITADRAQWNQTTWTLQNGKIYEFNDLGDLEFSDTFAQMLIHVDQSVQSLFSKQRTAREMDSRELKDKIKALSKGGISTRALQVEYHMKYSIPVACLIFGIIGIAFCLTFVRSGKDWWGVIIAICVAVLLVGFYFFLVALARAFAKEGNLTPLLGAWLPNIIYGTIGVTIIIYQSIFK